MIKTRIERYNNFKCIKCNAFYFEIVFVVFDHKPVPWTSSPPQMTPKVKLSTLDVPCQIFYLICLKVKLSTLDVPCQIFYLICLKFKLSTLDVPCQIFFLICLKVKLSTLDVPCQIFFLICLKVKLSSLRCSMPNILPYMSQGQTPP